MIPARKAKARPELSAVTLPDQSIVRAKRAKLWSVRCQSLRTSPTITPKTSSAPSGRMTG